MNTTDKLAACQKVMDLVDVYAACQTKDTRYEVRAALIETVDAAIAAALAAPAHVPLTDEQIEIMTSHLYCEGRPVPAKYRIALARIVEAAIAASKGGAA